MNTIEVNFKDLLCKIGKVNENGYVNVFMNFVPIDHVEFISNLKSFPEVEYVTNVMDHMDGTGGISLKIHTKITNEMIAYIIETLLIKHF